MGTLLTTAAALRTTATTLLIGAFAVCSTAMADVLEDDVPLALVLALLGGPPDQTVLYSGMPPGFPEVPVPDSVTVLGGVQMSNTRRVILDVGGPTGPVRDRMIVDMQAEGYLLITQPPQRPQQAMIRGFQTASTIPEGMPVQLCHDQHGIVMIRPFPGSRGAQINTLIELQQQQAPRHLRAPAASWSTGTGSAGTPLFVDMTGIPRQAQPGQPMSCQDMRDQQLRQGMPRGQSMAEHMPQLVMPAGAIMQQSQQGAIPRWSAFGGGGGVQPGMSTDALMEMDISLSALYTHFADQLREQDWSLESESEGSVTATGTWLANVTGPDGAEQVVHGVLTVARDGGEDEWRLRFMIW